MNTIYIETLLNTPRIGIKSVGYILRNFNKNPSEIKDLHDILIEAKIGNGRIAIPNIEELKIAYDKTIKKSEKARKAGIKAIGLNDKEFPKKFRQIPNPPVVLYVKGDLSCLYEKLTIAIIGTRKPSGYGQRAAERLGEIFASKKFIVVSGLAIGCDTAAHKGCLKSKGRTVAVLPSDLQTIYPTKNKGLAEKILESGGCLISEYPIGRRIYGGNFIERDRLQSGLSAGLVVIETGLKGGTMHTVGFALQQGRPIACLDHGEKHRHTPQAEGNRRLIEEGKAFRIRDVKDIENFIKTF